jgi:hypothetical protein
MLQAITSPALRSLAIGGLALGLTAAYASRHHCHGNHARSHRLALHAEAMPGAIYLTAWRDGDVEVTFENGELQPFQVEVTADLDGCSLLGIETLVPLDAHTFSYDYDEQILSCAPDSPQIIKTPRTGLVTVED